MKPDLAAQDNAGFDSLIRLQPRTMIALLLLGLVLAVAVQLRFFTFWLPHWKGDQSQYLTLAMKLKEFGFEGYNLRGADLRIIRLDDAEKNKFTYPVPTEGDGPGDILYALRLTGQAYYDEPFHHRAPLMPLTLLASHRIFAAAEQPLIVCSSNLAQRVLTSRPKVVLTSQFWAAVVPFTFSLIAIGLTFLVGRCAGGNRVGFYAGILMATNALGIMTSHRLWAEEMMLTFFTGALLVFYLAYSRRNYWGILAAGLLGGVAMMYKQTTGLVLVIVWVYMFVVYRPRGSTLKTFFLKVLNPPTLIFAAGFFLVSLPWFLKVIEVYGDPFYRPFVGWDPSRDVTGWFARLYRRPPPLILYSVGVAKICPLFALFILTWRAVRRGYMETRSGVSQNSWFVLLWVWVLVIYFQLSQIWGFLGIWTGAVREHRFFYMAYPALAVAAAYVLNQIRVWVDGRVKLRGAGEGVILALVIANALWSAQIGFKAVFANSALLY